MEFLYNLFWFPLNTLYFAVNVGLWLLMGYIVYEAIRQIKYFKQQGVNYLGQGTGVRTYEELTLFILFMDRPEPIPARLLGEHYENIIDKNISRNYASRDGCIK